ncbi:MAG: hypothetical protein BGP05_09710 [Rhizobiales bacterium 62-47]|nr:MAG: hypothetical protein BGP05_09710 [Rhizobiales bacterium 62-47]
MAIVGLALSASLGSMSSASAQTAAPTTAQQRASRPLSTDLSAQRRDTERPPTRLRVHPRYNPNEVYPRYNPGPNAVRDCTATYVQEFRPSGTVIVPHMTCFWRRG